MWRSFPSTACLSLPLVHALYARTTKSCREGGKALDPDAAGLAAAGAGAGVGVVGFGDGAGALVKVFNFRRLYGLAWA